MPVIAFISRSRRAGVDPHEELQHASGYCLCQQPHYGCARSGSLRARGGYRSWDPSCLLPTARTARSPSRHARGAGGIPPRRGPSCTDGHFDWPFDRGQPSRDGLLGAVLRSDSPRGSGDPNPGSCARRSGFTASRRPPRTSPRADRRLMPLLLVGSSCMTSAYRAGECGMWSRAISRKSR